MTTLDPTTIATTQLEQMERAWNHADGPAFGDVADDTDFVDIRRTHHRGDGAAIGHGHQRLFDSIYAGSTVRYQLDVARTLKPGCIVAVATSTLDAPSGPLQGINRSRITAVSPNTTVAGPSPRSTTHSSARTRETLTRRTAEGEPIPRPALRSAPPTRRSPTNPAQAPLLGVGPAPSIGTPIHTRRAAVPYSQSDNNGDSPRPSRSR